METYLADVFPTAIIRLVCALLFFGENRLRNSTQGVCYLPEGVCYLTCYTDGRA